MGGVGVRTSISQKVVRILCRGRDLFEPVWADCLGEKEVTLPVVERKDRDVESQQRQS